LAQTIQEQTELQQALMAQLDSQNANQLNVDKRISVRYGALVARLDVAAAAHDNLDSRLNTRMGDLIDTLEKERAARVAFQEQTAVRHGAVDSENQRIMAEIKDIQDTVTGSALELTRLVHEQQLERVASESGINHRLNELADTLESEHATRIESEKHDAATLADLKADTLSRFEETTKTLAEALHSIDEQAQSSRKNVIERFGTIETNFRADMQSIDNGLQERLASIPDIVTESVETEFTVQSQYQDSQWQGSPWSSWVQKWEQKRGSPVVQTERVQQPGVIFLHMAKTGGPQLPMLSRSIIHTPNTGSMFIRSTSTFRKFMD
jgi:hypothetical protein